MSLQNPAAASIPLLMLGLALPLTAAALPVLPAVNAALQPYIDRGEIAGAVAVLVQDGQVRHLQALGVADLSQKRPQRVDDLFWVASMTKPVTAAAVLMLVDEGKVKLDEPVGTYLAEFKHLPRHGPTLRQLLTHTSGLTDVPIPPEGTTLAEFVAAIARQPLAYEPGTKWAYGNATMPALGRIVEVVADQPFEDFLRDRLFTPLGMKDTTFYPSEEQAKRLAISYKPGPDAGSLVPTQSGFINGPVTSRRRTVQPGGGLFGTVNDFARFAQMLLNGGELDGRRYLKADTVAMMTRTQTDPLQTGFTPGMSFGLGVGVVKEPQGVTAMLSPGTFGHGGVYGTAMWIDPKLKRIYLLMIQRAELVPNGDGCSLRQDFQTAAAKALDEQNGARER